MKAISAWISTVNYYTMVQYSGQGQKDWVCENDVIAQYIECTVFAWIRHSCDYSSYTS